MALPPMAAGRQMLIGVDGIDGYWSRVTAISPAATATKLFDGGSTSPELVTSNTTTEDVTVSRPFRPGRDAALLATLYAQVNNWDTNIHVHWTDGNLVKLANVPGVMASGRLTKVDTPEGDSSSGDGQMLQLTFAIAAVTSA